MNYKLKIWKKVFKFLEKCDKNIALKFDKAVDILVENPYKNNLDIKRLVWSESKYRLRIWKYRFLYEVRENEILIYFYDANSRWDIY